MLEELGSIQYERYQNEEDKLPPKKIKKHKYNNTAMLDEDSPVNKYHKRGRKKIIRKGF